MRIIRANMQAIRRLDLTLYMRWRDGTPQAHHQGEVLFDHMRGFYSESVYHTDDGIYIERIEQAQRRATVFHPRAVV